MSTTGALLWLSWRQAVNRARAELKRVRQPRYLLGILAIGGYLWFFFLSRVPEVEQLERVRAGPASGQGAPLWRVGLEALLLLSATAGLLAAWLSRRSRTALTLSEAEATFLLSGPVSGRQLLHLRLGRFLFRAVLPGALWALLVGRRGGLHPLQVGLGLGLGTFLLGLHAAGASLVRARLAASRLRPLWQRVLPWGLTALVLGASALAVLRAGTLTGVAALPGWWARVEDAVWLKVLLAPAWLPIDLALAPDAAGALRAGLGCALLLFLHYLWLRALESTWLQAALPTDNGGVGERSAGLQQRAAWTPWRLSSRGAPALALVWKNLTAATRLQTGRFWAIGVMVVLAAGLVLVSVPGEGRGAALALICVGVAGFCALIGPGALRIDLRMELEGLDALRALPLPGWQLLGALLTAPALSLALLEWLLLGVALGLGWAAPLAWLPPRREWLFWMLGAMAGLPVVTLAGLTIHNAVAVFFPAWSRVEEAKGRGFEAFGQRLLTLFGTLLALLGGGLPAGFVGLVVGALLWPFDGALAALAGGLSATLTLLIEVACAVWLLGGVLDRLDPAEELAP